MSDTPRTDALLDGLHAGKSAMQVVAEDWTRPLLDHARTLEREAEALRAEVDRLQASRRRNLAATVANAKPAQIEAFWARVDKSGGPDACWPWTGRCNKDGYGHVWIGGKSDKRAHRVACALMGKVQPPDLVADHICKNRACCNPAHIEFVPQRTNVMRNGESPHAKNATKTECKYEHPLSGDNLHWRLIKGRLSRVCLACARRKRPNCKLQPNTPETAHVVKPRT